MRLIGYIGESLRSIVSRFRSNFELYKPGKGGGGGKELYGERGEEDEEMRKAGSWMREHSVKCHQGVFSQDKMQEFEFIVINTHSKVRRGSLKRLFCWTGPKVGGSKS